MRVEGNKAHVDVVRGAKLSVPKGRSSVDDADGLVWIITTDDADADEHPDFVLEE